MWWLTAVVLFPLLVAAIIGFFYGFTEGLK